MADAIAYCEQTINDFAQVAVNSASNFLDAESIKAQIEPSNEQVWKVCTYLDHGTLCDKCPSSWVDENGEEWRDGCYTVALETIKTVDAAMSDAT